MAQGLAVSGRGGWSREGQSSEARREAGGSGTLTAPPGRGGVSDGWVAPSTRTWPLGPCVLAPLPRAGTQISPVRNQS